MARLARNFSLRNFADLIHYSHSYLSKVENGVKRPTTDLAWQCDQALGLDGTLTALVEHPTESQRTWPRPAQLPPGPELFVGRLAELATITATVDAGGEHAGVVPVVTIDGPPGIGKTSLALRWAHQNLSRFPDGVLYADLRGHSATAQPASASDILAEFLQAMGIDRIPGGERQRAALLRSQLAGRRMLLMLDNAADAAQVRPLVPNSPGCAVLVTSRRSLLGLCAKDNARRVILRPLARADSLDLLVGVIGEQRVNAEPTAAVMLTGRCGGLPLAVRLVAEQVLVQPSTTLLACVEAITPGMMLDGLDAGGDPQATARSLFSWSYRALTPQAAAMFRTLGLYPGTEFSEQSMTALTGLPADTVAGVLRELSVGHLIEPADPGRYRIHQLLHLYAEELAVANEPHPLDTRRRFIAWYLEQAEAAQRALAGRTPLARSDALRWFEAELDNLPSVMTAANHVGLPEIVWRLPIAYWPYLQLNRWWPNWITTHQLGLAAARVERNTAAEALLLNNLGGTYRLQGKALLAEIYLRQALALRTELDDQPGRAWTLVALATTIAELGRAHDAFQLLNEALEAFRAAHHRRGEAVTLIHLGDVHRTLRQPAISRDRLTEALALLTTTADRALRAHALSRLGESQHQLGMLDEAFASIRAASVLHRASQDRNGEAENDCRLARLQERMGNAQAARRSWRHAAALFNELNDIRGKIAEQHAGTGLCAERCPVLAAN